MTTSSANARLPASGTNQQQTISDLMAEMAEAGAPFAAIQIAVRAIEFERGREAARKAKRAEEKRNQRAKKSTVAGLSPDCRATNDGQSPDMSADVSPDKTASGNQGVYINHARADGNPCSTSLRSVEIITPLPTVDPQGGSQSRKSEIVSILTECLSVQTANDLVAHRKSLKAPLTEGAARRLVKQLVESGDPEAAVSAMLIGGWKGFKPDWMKDKPDRAGPAQRGGGVAKMMLETMDRIAENERRSAQNGNPETARLLPFNAGLERGSDCVDDGGFSRPDIELLVTSSIRRM